MKNEDGIKAEIRKLEEQLVRNDRNYDNYVIGYDLWINEYKRIKLDIKLLEWVLR